MGLRTNNCKFQVGERDSECDLHNLFSGGVLDRSVIRGTVDAMVRIQIFMAGDLEEGGTSLAGNDSGPSQKEYPYAIPALPVGSDDLVLVGDPVLVPAPDGSSVVHTENVDILDLKAVILELR